MSPEHILEKRLWTCNRHFLAKNSGKKTEQKEHMKEIWWLLRISLIEKKTANSSTRFAQFKCVASCIKKPKTKFSQCVTGQRMIFVGAICAVSLSSFWCISRGVCQMFFDYRILSVGFCVYCRFSLARGFLCDLSSILCEALRRLPEIYDFGVKTSFLCRQNTAKVNDFSAYTTCFVRKLCSSFPHLGWT